VNNWTGKRIGVVGGPGDRRDEDFVQLGQLSATMFDRIFIKEDDDNRGRPRGDAARLISQGILQVRATCDYESILDETAAIEKALSVAPVGSLVVILPESVSRAFSQLEQYQSQMPVKPTAVLEAVSNSCGVGEAV
jgi:cyanophycin synthetase